ncbi:B12-binding domain-containing radical SAM protein [Candidatus Woesearchaeota archaeon]|nr:B12-binding domain-containing radical SAM protein [Candidatus Woesearchaeota archaeon]
MSEESIPVEKKTQAMQNNHSVKREIILIQPTTRWSEQITTRHPLTLPIPISLLTIASYLSDYTVHIVDQRIDHHWVKTLQRLLRRNPLFVGITAMTGRQIHFALNASAIVQKINRSSNTKVPVVWGGPHASLLAKQTLEHPLVDFVVVGEGEETIKELADKMSVGGDLSGIAGLGLKFNGTENYEHNSEHREVDKYKINPERKFIKMDEMPPLPYHLLDMDKYLSPKFSCRPIGIPASRGCPNRCAFCYDTTVHRSCWRAFSAERTLDEIETVITRFGINFIYFFESNSCVNIQRIKEIASGIIERNYVRDYGLTWEGLAEIKTLRNVDYDFYALLEKSGCRILRIGIESGSPRILDMIHKDLTPEEAIRVNKQLARFNIRPYYSFMNGFPTETGSEIKMTVDLMFRLRKDNHRAQFCPINTLMPYPGTELYDTAVKSGFTPPETLEGWIDIDSFDVMNKANFRMPWIKPHRAKQFEKMFYLSLFMDDKSKTIDNPLLNLAINAYKPIALLRLRKLMLGLMPEYAIYNSLSKTL